jgi:hypothetical protein
MENFGKFILVIFMLVFTTVLGGYVVSHFWGWFISPLGIRLITIPEAIGITFTVSFLTAKRDTDSKKSWNDLVDAFWYSLSFAAIGLLFGFVISLFV